MIYADLAVILIVAIAGFIGMKRGLARSLMGVFSIVISLALATWTYPIVANVINATELDETITHAIEKSLGDKEEILDETTEEVSQDKGFSILPKSALDSIDKKTDEIVDSARKTTAQTISTLAVNIISMLLVFLIVRLLMFILSHALNFITRLPVIRSVDKGLGTVAGLLSGIIIMYLLLTLLTFNTALNSDHAIGKAVKESYIASYMYDNNFIVSWISEK